MKAKYVLGLFIAIGIAQSSFATTFIIADMTQAEVNGVTNTREGQRSTIIQMAPRYKGDKKGSLKEGNLQTVERVRYKCKDKNGLVNNDAWGITGTTPLGFTLLRGVAFVCLDGNEKKIYRAEFEEKDIPSRLAVNVLVEIRKDRNSSTGENVYVARLYHNRLLSDKYTDIYFYEGISKEMQ